MFQLALASVFFGIVLASSTLHITDPPYSSPPLPSHHSLATDTSDEAPRVRETDETDDQGAETRERSDPEDNRPVGTPCAPHGQKKVVRPSHRHVEGPRKRLFYAAPADLDDDPLDMATLVRSFQLLSLAPRSERRPEKGCLKRTPSVAVLSSPSSTSKKNKKKKRKNKKKRKHVHFAKMVDEYEIPCVNHEMGLQDLGTPDYAGNIEMIDVDWHHDVYLEVVNDPAKSQKRFYKAAILSEWMFE